ncbi:hypothetical protein J3Q64DRAFT_1745733 [Phycomyces blakesleeanus]|uniref:Uncharacterized protein n=1 Tax=Phycomyces blakesleeanus TaxID=4837 RepID=A0ABR3AZ59_PHYBL
MTEPRTIVVLDGHPSTISLTVAPPDPNLTGLPQLPPFPLWSSIVDGTLGFCRIAWDLCRPDHAPVQVLVAKQETQVLNSWRDIDQSLVKVSNGFRAAQPNSPLLPSDKPRLAAAIKDAFMALLLNKGPPLPPWRRFRIVLVILRKRPDEVGYMYRDNEDDKEAVNLKSLVFEALHTLAPDKLSTIKHVQVDVLRLLPSNESLTDMLPCQISPQLTLSVYNVPNGRHDLHQAMINLAQQYYNINHLLVSNIPMKTKADLAHPNQTTTKSVEFYYQAGCQHRLDPKTPTSESRLHHPDFLKERTTNLLYLKRSKRSDSGWCTCMHAISPIKPSDPPTEVFLEMILKGSSSYLVTAEAHETNKKTWTHMLMEHQGGVYLRCLDRQTEALFSKAEGVPIKQDPERHNVKQEPDGGIGIGGGGGITPIKKELFVKDEFGPPVPIIEDRPSVPVAVTLPKPAVNVSAATLQEFMDSCVRPCVFESYEQFLGVSGPGNPCELVPFNPFRYSHQDTLPALLSTMATKDNKVFTNQYLERAARWRTCMRDCNGTDKFPVNLEARSIASCSVDVLNGSPLGTGFGVASVYL